MNQVRVTCDRVLEAGAHEGIASENLEDGFECVKDGRIGSRSATVFRARQDVDGVTQRVQFRERLFFHHMGSPDDGRATEELCVDESGHLVDAAGCGLSMDMVVKVPGYARRYGYCLRALFFLVCQFVVIRRAVLAMTTQLC